MKSFDISDSMMLAQSIADRLREVFFHGKWIANTNYREQLLATPWEAATARTGDLNSVALLTFHINYYLRGLIEALRTGELTISDRFSFDAPPITSQADWDQLVQEFLANAETFSNTVAQLHDSILAQPFIDEKYGTCLRNLEGVLEHSYYHLGQVVLLRKTAPAS